MTAMTRMVARQMAAVGLFILFGKGDVEVIR
jgi:hypothetical protein